MPAPINEAEDELHVRVSADSIRIDDGWGNTVLKESTAATMYVQLPNGCEIKLCDLVDQHIQEYF